MNKEAFAEGLLEKIYNAVKGIPDMPMQQQLYGAVGGIGGAASGALLSDDHMLRNALIGGTLGTGLGLGVGGMDLEGPYNLIKSIHDPVVDIKNKIVAYAQQETEETT